MGASGGWGKSNISSGQGEFGESGMLTLASELKPGLLWNCNYVLLAPPCWRRKDGSGTMGAAEGTGTLLVTVGHSTVAPSAWEIRTRSPQVDAPASKPAPLLPSCAAELRTHVSGGRGRGPPTYVQVVCGHRRPPGAPDNSSAGLCARELRRRTQCEAESVPLSPLGCTGQQCYC